MSKLRINKKIDRKLDRYTSKAISAISNGVLNIEDFEVKNSLLDRIGEISSTLRGNEELPLDYSGRVIWAEVHRGDLENYVDNQVENNRLTSQQRDKVKGYAKGLNSILIKHTQRLSQRKNCAEKTTGYYEQVRRETEENLSSTYENIQDVEFLNSIKSQMDSIAKIMKGEGVNSNNKKIRTYKERIRISNEHANKLLDSIKEGYTNYSLSSEDARKLIDQASNMLDRFSDSKYLKNKRKKLIKEGKITGNEFSEDNFNYSASLNMKGERKYFEFHPEVFKACRYNFGVSHENLTKLFSAIRVPASIRVFSEGEMLEASEEFREYGDKNSQLPKVNLSSRRSLDELEEKEGIYNQLYNFKEGLVTKARNLVNYLIPVSSFSNFSHLIRTNLF